LTVDSSTSSPDASATTAAFGLAVDADFLIHGLYEPREPERLPRVTVRLGDEAELDRAWRPEEATRVAEQWLWVHGGEPDQTIDVHPELGYRLFARYYGLCLIARDGNRIRCAPPPVASWRWQRFLAGRGLPIAALLQGYEVLHAGAVAIGDGVVAISGPSGAGKTSLTLQLVLGGARFFTDDVLPLSVDGDSLLAHPGLGLASVRVREHALLGPSATAALGEPIGQTGRAKLHYVLATGDEPLPLRALYLLRPAAGDAAGRIRPLPDAEPLQLLTTTFLSQVRRPEHLASLLDVCARLSTTVPVFELVLGAGEESGALAARLSAHVQAEALV
jgi:hypothetical protein